MNDSSYDVSQSKTYGVVLDGYEDEFTVISSYDFNTGYQDYIIYNANGEEIAEDDSLYSRILNAID